MDLRVKFPCTMDLEVEFDLNPTDLYNNICASDWESALYCIAANPIEAKIWVVKRNVGDFADDEIACRFLPLHSACARQPPLPVISALINSYPEGTATRDDNGMYPLHYACANQASSEVIRLLLLSFPEANFSRIETTGNLPVHLVAQWGASSVSVIDILLENSVSLACAKDYQEKSPLEVALAASEYENRKGIIRRLRKAVEHADRDDMTSSTITTVTWSVLQEELRNSKYSRDDEEGDTRVQEHIVPYSTSSHTTTAWSVPHEEERDSITSRGSGEVDAIGQENIFSNSTKTFTTAAWSVPHEELEEKINKPLINGEEVDTIVQTNMIPHWTTKSITRMKAEIMALRAHKEFIQAEAEEQVAHEWKEVQNVISTLNKRENSLNGSHSSSKKTHSLNSSEKDIGNPLTPEEEAKLCEISLENEGLKLEHDRLKKVCDEYRIKVDTMHDIIFELSQHTKKLIIEQNNAHERVNMMESNMQVVSAWRQTRLQRMLREEKSYYSEVTDVRNEIASVQRSELTEELVKREMALLDDYDAILHDIEC